MICAAVLALATQWLQPSSGQAEVGQTVRIEVHDGSGGRLAELPVTARGPDAVVLELGRTDDAGGLVFTPGIAGEWTLRAQIGSVELLAPFYAAEPPRRWLYALWCTPIGLYLLWRNLRALRRERRAAALGQLRPEPSRPGP